MSEDNDTAYETHHRSRSSIHQNKNEKRRHKKKRFSLTKFLLFLFLGLIVAAGIYVYKIYGDLRNTSVAITTSRPEEQVQVRPEPVNIEKEQKPFSVLLLGIDTGDLGRIDQGRSDVMIVATVNPNTNQTTLTSIPRDTLTEIVGYGTTDKINHAYAFGGMAMAVNTVQNLLDIPIDFTITVNMKGFSDVVDAVGGVTLTPTVTFEQRGYQFVEGQTMHLDGDQALAYSQNRYDTGGDYGRQERQRQLIEALLAEVIDFSLLYRYNDILISLEDNVTTDLTFDEIVTLSRHYTGAASNVVNYQLTGHGEMIDGIYYEIIEDDSLNSISSQLKTQLEIESAS
ncbi:LCP family glycopolymer transferase [Fundicoccus culcitae]|uniref:LCP family protein n=1 Tax=Fundicoccus culcitae TaxID=2969821 RepID=A0ABY5P5U2_9LACT|nr:LCP family protein [Fundicoccus culcitae]UUX34077.1 LCP family protein [Fundicoccus culcitae]